MISFVGGLDTSDGRLLYFGFFAILFISTLVLKTKKTRLSCLLALDLPLHGSLRWLLPTAVLAPPRRRACSADSLPRAVPHQPARLLGVAQQPLVLHVERQDGEGLLDLDGDVLR